MSAEGGASGAIGAVGFDHGSPTFSGLGRSDSSIGSFSVNEGPKGPVSFNNSIDLFAETKPITSPTFSVPEGSVSLSDLKDTFPIAKNSVPVSEIDIESIIDSEAQLLGVSTETIGDAIEDLRTNDPLVARQLETDLKSVAIVVDLAHEVTDKDTAARISNTAIETAVGRSGLVKAIEEETAPRTQTRQETRSETQSRTDTEVREQTQPEQVEEEYFVDEDANSARRTETGKAIAQAFEENVDPKTGKVKGSDVVAHLSPEPSSDSISKVVLRKGSKNDGSERSRRNQIASHEFGSVEEAEASDDRAIKDNNAVTDEKAEKIATKPELQKATNETGVQGVRQIYPMAA